MCSGRVVALSIQAGFSERLVNAEVGVPPPEQPVQLPSGSTGALCGLFLAACRGEASSSHSES